MNIIKTVFAEDGCISEIRDIVFQPFTNGHSQNYRCEYTLGNFDDYTIATFSKEVNVPHFHFYKGNKIPPGGIGGGCIMIKEARYYPHASHQATMSSAGLKELNEFFQSMYEGKRPVWRQLLRDWNSLNHWKKFDVGLDLEMPDYTKLLKPIGGTKNGITNMKYFLY